MLNREKAIIVLSFSTGWSHPRWDQHTLAHKHTELRDRLAPRSTRRVCRVHHKHTELRDRLAPMKLQLDVLNRSHDEAAKLAAKAFELSQALKEQWVMADCATTRRPLEIVCLNCRLDGRNLVFSTRKPFDVLAEGLELSKSRGDRI